MRTLGCEMMVLFLALICIHVCGAAAQTTNSDSIVLKALTDGWGNLPQSWGGDDPCSGRWEGIKCNENSRIVSITLASMGLTGRLTGDLASLSELQILDLSYNKDLTGSIPSKIGDLSKLTNLILLGCSFSGTIPDSVGSLKKLKYLSLNSNKFVGEIPATIGNLKNLYWPDLSDNLLTGRIPVSDGSNPGLDLLVQTKHFHFGMNRLSGEIPRNLFSSNLTLIHVLFDNNNLTGSIPETLGLVKDLQSVRFDRNFLSGDLPANLNNLTNVNELVLSNNVLTGPVPNLTGMDNLISVDLSNNSFAATTVPQWFSTIQSLTTVLMERTGLEGKLPVEFFNIPQLQTVNLKSNQLNGTLDIGNSHSPHLQVIDLQNNTITDANVVPGNHYKLELSINPYCQNSEIQSPFCNKNEQGTSASYKTPTVCIPPKCTSNQMSSPICKCAYPYTGRFVLRSPSFSASGNEKYFNDFQQNVLGFFHNASLPVDSLSITNVALDIFGYLNIQLAFFPSGQENFNRTAISALAFALSNQTYQPANPKFKPYVFRADSYTAFEETRNSSHRKAYVGAVIGVSTLLLLLICVGVYAYKQRKRAEKANYQANPFVSWDSRGTSGDVPQLKGAKHFKFEELLKCTNHFSEANNVGSGGYGKVYRGVLADGQIVAIKRSQHGSKQGSREFKNEIELLSRVHHKNLVKLIGFCFDQAEQMLVYEFIPNGTLMDSLSGKSGIQLDWTRRLKIALGSARGLLYLHELADPPIIHRDIKSNNILLDEDLKAKVADFGLSRLFGDVDKGYVTTQVKGTMGYLDPEYFMNNQLTEKSDIFSFGVVLLEMLTARKPIQLGKYIVKVTKETIDKTKDLYNLSELMDPKLLSSSTTLVGFEKFVDLTMKCLEDLGADRPTTSEVVKDLESIMQLAGMNPNDESTTTSQSYEGSSGQSSGHASLF